MKKGRLFCISSTLDYSISSVIKFTIYIIEMYTNVIKKTRAQYHVYKQK